MNQIQNKVIIRDLSTEMSERSLNTFCQTNNSESIVDTQTWFKNSNNPSCIYLMVTNKQEGLLKVDVPTLMILLQR